MIQLETQDLVVQIAQKGAELSQLYDKRTGIDFLWDADPKYWAKHAPVLFPIVGTLKNNQFIFKGKHYSLPRHGFARDHSFELIFHQENEAIFEWSATSQTLLSYPFFFRFRIHYLIKQNALWVSYEVRNEGDEILYFSVGGHPAFKIPYIPNTRYEDYYLEFNLPETAPRWTLEDNLINIEPTPFLINQRTIPLSHSLFSKDAIVLKNIQSSHVSLKSNTSNHGLSMQIDQFPYLGIWAAANAPFLCIEPWQGIADSINHNQNLLEKEGIVPLNSGSVWQRQWSVTLF
ncbi:MAG: aldose 1-epimerase family protein [Bacteroidetes bacterium]|nr:aldose 1-epimerase family protein [Bacteroidota bacterium]MBS1740582.1 aldose 1-epimerase family protein [Bacteroidota bacterium]